MTVITTSTNISALRAIRRLESADRHAAVGFERLSSGLRINQASDDAAGLAVSIQLNAKSAVLRVQQRSLNDSLSFLNVAEGALKTIGLQIDRIKELASQAANGVYTTQQRQALDVEAQALKEEVNRIINSTTFNGKQVFGSNGQEFTFVTGDEGVAQIRLGVAYPLRDIEGLGSFSQHAVFSDPAQTRTTQPLGDINGDGHIDLLRLRRMDDEVYIRLGNGDGTFSAKATLLTGVASTHSVSLSDFDGDGIHDLIANSTVSTSSATFLKGNGDGTFRAPLLIGPVGGGLVVNAVDINGDGILDVASGSGSDYLIRIGNGNGTFGAPITGVSGGSSLERVMNFFSKNMGYLV